ncbi:MAG: hypothetical protein M1836_000370 [Candelina mexicana]|nr:MAG: hypothetical protein M1836_000370 [Candelina mexicana]
MSGNGYSYTGSGTNSQVEDPALNCNGSYYYSNSNGSTYYNNGQGGSTYTAPGGSSGSGSQSAGNSGKK